MIKKILKKIKGSEYKLDPNITSIELFYILFGRFSMVLKGFYYKIFKTKAKGLFFIGRKVKIQFGKKLKFGKNCTINNNCQINALVKKSIAIGNNFSLGSNSIIEGYGVLTNLGEGLIIGDNVGISPNALISIRGEVKIGNETIIGPYFSIHPENHIFNDFNISIRKQGVTRKGIVIGNNCWIGAKVTILDGVTIGDNSIVAAGSVVTKNVLENSIVGGVPARVLDKRIKGEVK